MEEKIFNILVDMQSDIKCIKKEQAEMKKEQNLMKQDIKDLKDSQAEMKKDQATMKQDIKELREDQATMKQDIKNLKNEQTQMKCDIETLMKYRIIDSNNMAKILNMQTQMMEILKSKNSINKKINYGI